MKEFLKAKQLLEGSSAKPSSESATSVVTSKVSSDQKTVNQNGQDLQFGYQRPISKSVAAVVPKVKREVPRKVVNLAPPKFNSPKPVVKTPIKQINSSVNNVVNQDAPVANSCINIEMSSTHTTSTKAKSSIWQRLYDSKKVLEKTDDSDVLNYQPVKTHSEPTETAEDMRSRAKNLSSDNDTNFTVEHDVIDTKEDTVPYISFDASQHSNSLSDSVASAESDTRVTSGEIRNSSRKSHFRKPKAKFKLSDLHKSFNVAAEPSASVFDKVVHPKPVSNIDDVKSFAEIATEVPVKKKKPVQPIVFSSSKSKSSGKQRHSQIKLRKVVSGNSGTRYKFNTFSSAGKQVFTPFVNVTTAAQNAVVGSIKTQYQKRSQSMIDGLVAGVEVSKKAALQKIRSNFDLSQPCSGKFDKSRLGPDQAYISEHNFKSIVQLSSFAILIMLCLSFTVNLWMNSEHGFGFRNHMIQDLALINTEIDEIVMANTELEKEIFNYSEDKQTVESMVRFELGMIKPDETFVRIVR